MDTSDTAVTVKAGRRRWFLSAAAFLLVAAAALYFRSYELLPRQEISEERRREIAENLVRQGIQNQILTQLRSSGSQIPKDQQAAFAAQQTEALLRTDQKQFEEAVNRLLSSMPPSLKPPASRRYLLESDPYHFMAQVQNILETGKVSERIENGKFHDPLRCYPHGYWVPVGAQPLVGIAVYKVMDFFKPGIELMEALGYVPLVLVSAGLLAFFLLSRTLGFGTLASSAGALTLALSPIYLQRSSYGWFDTDPFNHLFPTLILALFFKSFQASPRQAICYGAGAGALTGLYVLFWLGWPFIFLLVLGMTFVFSVRFWIKKDEVLKGMPSFFPAYLVTTLVIGVAAAGPATFMEFIFRGARYIGKFAVSEPDTWPNIFLMVGETTSVSLKRMIFLTGNFVTSIFVVLGVISILWIRKRPELRLFKYRWTALLLMAVPLLLLSLATERFAVLLVTPVALLTGLAIESLGFFAGERFQAWRLSASGWRTFFGRFGKAGWTVLVLVTLLPMQFLFAHALAMKSEPIMNDTWYSSIQALREKTPANAVIYSWWPPGYFISTLAKRSVFADGGNQDLPGSYWLARVFMAVTEEEALGVMRMMNGSGNDALEKLRASGMRLAEAMDLLNQILPLNTQEARKVLLSRLDASAAENLLKLTHEGAYRAPTYLFIYSEMVEKNLAMSVFARWNFHKAALIQRKASESGGFLGLFKGGRADSIQQFLASSEGVLKYRPEEELERQEGSKLYFRNGLIVDWETKKALIQIPSEGVAGPPSSLFYVDQGELKEVPAEGGALQISALVYEDQGKFFSVIADRDLIRSMLYRLYYLKGAGLRSFKPLFEQSGETPKMTVQIFETHWDAALPEKA